MATLGEVGELVTTQLRERVDELVSAVEEDEPDLAEVSGLADAVGDLADTIARIYSDLDQALTGGEETESEQPQQRTQGNGATDEGPTKEELLERAREVNVEGRSSMSKEELAQAVEAEEGRTKEELLERARDAEIEGRSSMTKDELREALNEARA